MLVNGVKIEGVPVRTGSLKVSLQFGDFIFLFCFYRIRLIQQLPVLEGSVTENDTACVTDARCSRTVVNLHVPFVSFVPLYEWHRWPHGHTVNQNMYI